MTKAKLNIYLEEQIVGIIEEDAQNHLNFIYDSQWFKSPNRFSISHSMPLRKEPYHKEAQNYFANLLPEGDVRIAVAAKFGVSSENDFRMLEALGGNVQER